MLSLTLAYDICPQNRSGNEASQAMLISGDNRMSRVASCVEAAHHFLLSQNKVMEITKPEQKPGKVFLSTLKFFTTENAGMLF